MLFSFILFFISAEAVRSHVQVRRGPPLRRFINNGNTRVISNANTGNTRVISNANTGNTRVISNANTGNTRVISNANTAIQTSGQNGQRNNVNNSPRKTGANIQTSNGNKRLILLRNKAPINNNNKNNGQGKFMIDMQSFVNFISQHLGRNNGRTQVKANNNRNSGPLVRPLNDKPNFNLPVNKHPAVLTRARNPARPSGSRQNQKPNTRSMASNARPRTSVPQMPRAVILPATKGQLDRNGNGNIANTGNVNQIVPNRADLPNRINGIAGNKIINANMHTHGNIQKGANVNGKQLHNPNEVHHGLGNTNGQNSNKRIISVPNSGPLAGAKKPFDNYFQELQGVVNQMLNFDISKPLGGTQGAAVGGSQGNRSNAASTIGKSGGSTGGSNTVVASGMAGVGGNGQGSKPVNNNRHGFLLHWAQSKLNGGASGLKQNIGNGQSQINGQTLAQGNANAQGNVNNNERQITGISNQSGNRNTQTLSNGNALNNVHNNKPQNEIGKVGMPLNNAAGSNNMQTNRVKGIGNGQTNGNAAGKQTPNNKINNKNNKTGTAKNNNVQSMSAQVGTTSNTVDVAVRPNTNLPPAKTRRRRPKKKGPKGKGKGGNKQGQNAEVAAGQQTGGNSSTPQITTPKPKRKWMTYPPCPDAPCCGSDGRSYMAPCYITGQ